MAADSAKEQYIESYKNYVNQNMSAIVKIYEENGLSPQEANKKTRAIVDKGISCHIQILNDYPEPLRKALFNTIAAGGSYADAINELTKAVEAEKSAGNDDIEMTIRSLSKKQLLCTNEKN